MMLRGAKQFVLALALCFGLVGTFFAQNEPPSDPKPEKYAEKQSVTKHDIAVKGKNLAYTATVGYLTLEDEQQRPTGNVFFMAYTLDGAPAGKRPVTFAFNGGPGSSSVWLHLGLLGPKRVLLKNNGEPLPPPYQLVDNEYTLLDQSDIVLIDPVSTGFSRPAVGKEGKMFHGVSQDVDSIGEFIRLYLTKYKRWASPKFLCGESYGTTRSAGLANHLQARHGINLNGIVLVSAVLNFETLRPDEGNDLPYPLYLPSYTATAWYHKKLPGQNGELRKVLDAAERFAETDYTVALMKGSKLAKADQQKIAKQMAHLTGLSEKYILQSNLRIKPHRFFRELLRDEGLSVGRYDSRYTGKNADGIGEQPDYDPSYAAVQGPYTSTMNQYVRDELKFESEMVYEILTGKVQPWDFGGAKNRYLNVAPDLRKAMTENTYLKVFVANGYYDLATPNFATEYTFNHLGLDATLAKNVTMGYYEAGHMMYLNLPSLQQLRQDLAAFYQSALPAGGTTTATKKAG
jgi:carboxypeptidase C (cathepsin A)